MLGGGEVDGVRLFEQDALASALRPQAISSPAQDPVERTGAYGYGFNTSVTSTGRTMVSHSGAFVLGAATCIQMVPSLDLGVVVLTNAAPVGVAEAVAASITDIAQTGHLTRDWFAAYGAAFEGQTAPEGDLVGQTAPADASPPADLATYAGTWDNPYFGAAQVSVEGDGLRVALGPDGGYTLDLTPWDGDVFALEPSGENAPAGSLSSATFDLAAGTLVLQFFDGDGLGTFTRSG